MCFKLLLFLLTLCLPLPTRAIIQGNKISIQLVPWLVHGNGMFNHEKAKFCATLIHPQLALTVAPIVKNYKNITLVAGRANILREGTGQIRNAESGPFNKQLGILKVREPFLLGHNVQLGSLATRWTQLHHWNPYLAAGWGQVNWFNAPQMDLHCTRVYPSYKGMGEDERMTKFLLTGFVGQTQLLGHNDIGGPVWDMLTGEIVGLIFKWEFRSIKNYHSVYSVGNHRNWILSTVPEALDSLEVPANSTETSEGTEMTEMTEMN